MAITVTIGGTAHTGIVHPYGFTIRKKLGQRDECLLELRDDSLTYSPTQGQEISISDGGTVIFGGVIDRIENSLLFGTENSAGAILYSVEASGYAQYFDRHRVAGVYDTQSLKSIIDDLIVKDLGGGSLSADGITTTHVDTGPDITGPVIFGYCTATEAMDHLCLLAGYEWWVDAEKNLYCTKKTVADAPFSITAASTEPLADTLRVAQDTSQYANRVVVRADMSIVPTVTETFTGDGAETSFYPLRPLGETPTITRIDTTPDPDTRTLQSVGVFGVDSGMQWYWLEGTQVIHQEVGDPVLAATEQLEVVYRPLFANIVTAQDDAEIAARSAIEGGTGLHEVLIDDRDLQDLSAAQERADAELRRRKVIPKTITYQTRTRVQPGQLQSVTLAAHGLGSGADFLLESVEQVLDDDLCWRYTVSGTTGESRGDWVKSLGAALGGQAASGGSADATTPEDPSAVTGVTVTILDKDGNFGLRIDWTNPGDTTPITGYEREVKYYLDSGGVTPESEWIPLGPLMGVSTTADSGYWPRPTDATRWAKVRVRTFNSANTTSTWAESAAMGEITAVSPAGITPPLNATSVSASEQVSERTTDENGVTYTRIYVVPVMPVGHNADFLHVWITDYDNTSWWYSRWPIADTIKLLRMVPAAGASWQVKVLAGRWDADATGDPVVSAPFAIAPVGDALATSITDAVLGVPFKLYNAEGSVRWGINVSFTLPNDPTANFWTSKLTIQARDSLGNVSPNWDGQNDTGMQGRVIREFSGAGRVVNVTIVDGWGVPADGYAYNNYWFHLYLLSKNDNEILQTVAWSNADHAVAVVDHETALLDLSQVDTSTMGAGFAVKDGKFSRVDQAADNLILNPGFEDELGPEWEELNYDTGAAGTGISRGLTGGYGDLGAYLIMATGACGVRQRVTARPSQSIYLECFVFPSPAANHSVYLIIRGFAADGTLTGQAYATGNQAVYAWQKLTVTYTLPSNTAYFHVWIVPDGGMTAGYWAADNCYCRYRIDAEVARLAAPLTALNGEITVASKGVTNAYLGDTAVAANNMAQNAITAANAALAANSVVDANVANVGVPKLVAGTVIFSGDVVMSRGSSAPVMVLGSAGINLFSVANGPGSGGLTTSPYVVVASGSIGLYSGGDRSVTLTSSAVYLWSVNGNAAYPYVGVSAIGVTLASGNFTNTVSSSQIQMAYSGGASATLTSAQFKLLNGTYSVIVASSQIQLWSVDGNNLYPFVGMTSSAMYIGAGDYLVSITPSQIQLLKTGGAVMTLSSTSLTIQSGSASLVLTASNVSITRDANNHITVGAGTVTITSAGVSTTISGSSLYASDIFCSNITITPGAIKYIGVGIPLGSAGALAGYLSVIVNATAYKFPIYAW